MNKSYTARYPIIPKPVKIEPRIGNFLIEQRTVIRTDHQNRENAYYLQSILSRPTGYQLQIRREKENEENSIILEIKLSLLELGEEGYFLSVDDGTIKITSSSTKGVFYGIQTLRQFLPVEIESKNYISDFQWLIPCVKIEDNPRFSWRGFMLDEARHFQGIENIKRTIDLMALQKLNTLHWHLTDDQGWRIEITQYPNLTVDGSKRVGTSRTWMDSVVKNHDGNPHSGFYSQEELRETIAYASERNITVIPEIDIPGHSSALISSYPHLSCSGVHKEVPTSFGVYRDILCVGKESTYEFIEDVLDEVVDIFPSPLIHLGGDEVPKTRWKKCPSCQKKIFNEDPAMQRGNYVINSSFLDTYLDHSYTLTPLKRAYNFNPIFPEVDDEFVNKIIGIEAPLWTE